MRRFIRRLGVLVGCAILAGCVTQSSPAPPPTDPAPAPSPQPTQPVTYTVRGVVSEVVNDLTVPLEGAHVEDSERHVWVNTRADGSYTMPDAVFVPREGGAHIYFAKPGYKSQVHIVSPPNALEARVDVTLVRE